MRSPCLTAFLLALTACGAERTEPSGQLLLGTWGSAETELIAIRAGAEVRLPCATIVIEEPIQVDPSNTFVAHGRLDTSMAEMGELPVVQVSGTLRDSQVLITFPHVAGGEGVTHVLEAGVRLSPTDIPMCPQ